MRPINAAPIDPPPFHDLTMTPLVQRFHPHQPIWRAVVFATGFRIFFLSAAVHTIIGMTVWLRIYTLGEPFPYPWAITVWHGYDMIYGYTAAVVAGFLLTAVMNWTGRPTLRGRSLFGLWSVWLIGRIGHFVVGPQPWPVLMPLFDGVFLAGLFAAAAVPIRAVGQGRRQRWILVFLALLLTGWGYAEIGLITNDLIVQRKGLRLAVLAVIGLIAVIGRRVIPFFTERGMNLKESLPRANRFDEIGQGMLLAACAFWVFPVKPQIWTWFMLAAGLSLLVDLVLWYRHGVWERPLLWVLYLGFFAAGTGLLLWGLSGLFSWKDDTALHVLTAGGIGLMTLGMMCRVAWGHTGRPILHPPRLCGPLFMMMGTAAVLRTTALLMDDGGGFVCFMGSQLLWVLVFMTYLWRFGPILLAARPDGKPG